jgi:hypothetical protein
MSHRHGPRPAGRCACGVLTWEGDRRSGVRVSHRAAASRPALATEAVATEDGPHPPHELEPSPSGGSIVILADRATYVPLAAVTSGLQRTVTVTSRRPVGCAHIPDLGWGRRPKLHGMQAFIPAARQALACSPSTACRRPCRRSEPVFVVCLEANRRCLAAERSVRACRLLRCEQ